MDHFGYNLKSIWMPAVYNKGCSTLIKKNDTYKSDSHEWSAYIIPNERWWFINFHYFNRFVCEQNSDSEKLSTKFRHALILFVLSVVFSNYSSFMQSTLEVVCLVSAFQNLKSMFSLEFQRLLAKVVPRVAAFGILSQLKWINCLFSEILSLNATDTLIHLYVY